MVELYIDSVACDLDAGYMPDKSLFSLDAEADVEQQRSGRRLTLTLPASPRNDVILLHPADPLAAERFNSSGIPRKVILHKGRLRYTSEGYSGSPSKLADEITYAVKHIKNEK